MTLECYKLQHTKVNMTILVELSDPYETVDDIKKNCDPSVYGPLIVEAAKPHLTSPYLI